MKRTSSCHHCHCPQETRARPPSAFARPSKMPCQKAAINFEKLYREDHKINYQYHTQLLEKMNTYEKKTRSAQNNFAKLAEKHDRVVSRYQSNLDVTKSLYKKYSKLVQKNKALSHKFSESQNFHKFLLNSLEIEKNKAQQASDLFYQGKIAELRDFYRTTFDIKPASQKSENLPAFNSSQVSNNNCLKSDSGPEPAKRDSFTKTVQTSFKRNSKSSQGVPRADNMEQAKVLKNQIDKLDREIEQLKKLTQRRVN